MDDSVSRMSAPSTAHSPTAQQVDEAFRAFVGDAGFPCLAAKGLARRRTYELRLYGTLGSTEASDALAADLAAFAARLSPDGDRLTAFVAAFAGPRHLSEHAFERDLWT